MKSLPPFGLLRIKLARQTLFESIHRDTVEGMAHAYHLHNLIDMAVNSTECLDNEQDASNKREESLKYEVELMAREIFYALTGELVTMTKRPQQDEYPLSATAVRREDGRRKRKPPRH